MTPFENQRSRLSAWPGSRPNHCSTRAASSKANTCASVALVNHKEGGPLFSRARSIVLSVLRDRMASRSQ
jgi:hypothetical protein